MAENENDTETHKVVLEQLGTGERVTITVETPAGTTYKEAVTIARQRGATTEDLRQWRAGLIAKIREDKDRDLSNSAIAQKYQMSESSIRTLLSE